MNWISALLIGLLIGWLGELAVDFFYWRKRRLCPEDTVVEMQKQVKLIESKNKTLSLELGEKDGRLDVLTGDLAGHKEQTQRLETELGALESRWAALNTEHARCQQTLQLRDDRLTSLEESLSARKAQLGELDAALAEFDNNAQGLGLSPIFEGRSLDFAGFWLSLQNRLGSLRGDIDTRDSEIAALKLEMTNRANLQASLRGKEVELDNLKLLKDSRNAEIEALRLQLDSQLAEMNRLSVDLQNRQIELDNLFVLKESRNAEIDALKRQLQALGDDHTALRNKEVEFGNLSVLVQDRNAKISTLKATVAELNAKLEERETAVSTLTSQSADLQQQLKACQDAQVASAVAEPEAGYRGPSGLSMIWGLNTAANESLQQTGITNYQQLARTTPAQVDDALGLASRYYPGQSHGDIHSAWVEQANFAASADWDGLSGYQSRFDWAALKDDLKLIWGIGPKIEEVLNQNGVYLFSQLTSVPADRITEILRRAGSRFRMSTGKLHESWPEQARLADRGDWEAFETLKEKLSWDKVN